MPIPVTLEPKPIPATVEPKRERRPRKPPAFDNMSEPTSILIRHQHSPPVFEDLSDPKRERPQTPPAFDDLSDPLTPPTMEDLPERPSLPPAFEDLPKIPFEDLPKIPSADEILNGLAPMKSKQKYDAAWAEFLAFLNSPQYSTVFNKCPGKSKNFALKFFEPLIDVRG